LPRQGSLTDALLARDITCRLTDTVEGTEHAHLVPRSEVAWFQENTMFRYGVSPRPEVEPIDVPRNALLLRSDVHTVFDQRRFAIIPKPLPPNKDSPVTHSLAVHVFSPGSSIQFTKLYHHVALQPLNGISLEYLFARFAWTIFAYSTQFLQQGAKRALSLVQNGEVSIQELDSEKCLQLYQRRKPRSLSPQKRKRDTAEVQEEEEGEEWRGRPRLRSWESERGSTSVESVFAEDTPRLTDSSTVASEEEHIPAFYGKEDLHTKDVLRCSIPPLRKPHNGP